MISDISTIDFITQDGERKRLSYSKKSDDIIDKSIDYLQCSVCNTLYEKSIKTRKCDHALCATCYLELKKSNKTCPMCRTDLSSGSDDPLITASMVERSIISQVKESLKEQEGTSDEQTKNQAQAQKNHYDICTKKNQQIATIEQQSDSASLSYNPDTTATTYNPDTTATNSSSDNNASSSRVGDRYTPVYYGPPMKYLQECSELGIEPQQHGCLLM